MRRSIALALCVWGAWVQRGDASITPGRHGAELSGQPPAYDPEPEPAPTEIIELAPPPPAEPAPTPPAGEGATLSGGGAAPSDPGRRGGPALLPGGASRRSRRSRGGDDPGSQWGACGNPGRGLQIGFTLREHEFSLRWVDRTLHGIIANRCQSKTYRDILALDGGTVGIAHFAAGSLLTLYQQINTARYFGVPARAIPDRPYRLSWWREGMQRFLAAPEAKAAQQRAWRAYISPALNQALQRGWRSDRELAIAASVANSLGAYGFTRLAGKNRWDAERTLRHYGTLSAHKERRRQRLNLEFPLASARAALGRRR